MTHTPDHTEPPRPADSPGDYSPPGYTPPVSTPGDHTPPAYTPPGELPPVGTVAPDEPGFWVDVTHAWFTISPNHRSILQVIAAVIVAALLFI